MLKKVPNIQGIINNDILKIVNIVFSKGGGGGGGGWAQLQPWKGAMNKIVNLQESILKIL